MIISFPIAENRTLYLNDDSVPLAVCTYLPLLATWVKL